MKKRKIALAALLIALVIAAAGCFFYINDYYRAAQSAFSAAQSDEAVTVSSPQKRQMVFSPQNPEAGLIFYPGGKVEYTAYAPLMRSLAEQGLLCILLEMPANLAVLDADAADGLQDLFPEVDTWYIGGHSLGGAMAANHVSDREELYEGLILLASYSTADLSGLDLSVLSLYGSNDTVLSAEKYEAYFSNLPQDTTELVIEGGCHAYFGSYGPQDGDGVPTISEEEQIRITSEAISAWIA